MWILYANLLLTANILLTRAAALNLADYPLVDQAAPDKGEVFVEEVETGHKQTDINSEDKEVGSFLLYLNPLNV
jgi:hypothetical protein